MLCGLSASCSGASSSSREATECWWSRGKGGSVAPAGAWGSWGDGTRRSRAGLPSDGPPGLGRGLGKPELSQVNQDATRFFAVSFRYRCRCRCRSRRVRRGFAGRVHRSPGACRFGGFIRWEQCPFATFCDFCGQPPVIEAKGARTKTRRGAGTKIGCHYTPVLASSRLERSGREESVQVGEALSVVRVGGKHRATLTPPSLPRPIPRHG